MVVVFLFVSVLVYVTCLTVSCFHDFSPVYVFSFFLLINGVFVIRVFILVVATAISDTEFFFISVILILDHSSLKSTCRFL